MLGAQLPLEMSAIEAYEAGILACLAAGDNDTRDLLAENLHDETDHVGEIETALGLIKRIGADNFEQAMM